MLNSYKLKTRILIGYSLPIALFLGAAITTAWGINQVRKGSDSVQDASSVLENVQASAFHFATIQKTARGYLLQKTDTSLEAYKKNVGLFQEKSLLLKSLIVDAEQGQLADEIISLGGEVIEFNDNLINLINTGRADEALAIWRSGAGRNLAARLDTLLAQFVEEEIKILGDRRGNQERLLTTISSTVIIISILSTVLSVILANLITNAISKQVNRTVQQVVTTSQQIDSTVTEQERTITDQATSVNETTTTVEELGATSRQSAQQADVSSEGARQALDLSEEGVKSVNKTMQGINDLQTKVTDIADQIVNLSEQTSQISGISDLVSDVANQTNMLALNAAVEAARAGEQGKGFTVVAEEIRKLAEQTKTSAEKINSLVDDIQSAINSTIMVTDQGQKTAIEGIKLAENSAQTFKEISNAVNNVFVNSQQISMSSKQQAVAIQQVISAMNTINLGAQETSTGIVQVKGAVTELGASAADLQKLV